MASPFYLFRKYQKAFLVVAGVLAMFIFVVADPLMSWLQSSSGGGGQRSGKAIVATWDGGKLSAQQLDHLTRRRIQLHDFLQNLQGTAARIIQEEGGTPLAPAVPNFLLQENTSSQQVQQGCITTRVLAELATESDISISDEFINHYLKEWGLRKMGNAKISAMLSRVGMKEKTLFTGLRELLLGNFYINSFGSVTAGTMPQQRWEDWKRINQRIAVEAAVLPAEKFISEVPEPNEAELQQFYDQYNDRIDGIPQSVMGAQLPSPDPGFREPRRVRLQYLLGDMNEWTHKFLDKVTEEEISDYYDRNKRTQFVKTSTGSLFEDEEAEEDEKPDEKSDEKSDEGEDKEDTASEAEAGETSADEEPAAAEEPKPAAEAKADEGDSGRLDKKSPFRLAAFQTEAAESTDEAEEASDETSTEADEEEPVEYVPLEEVSDQIRRQLATDKAVVELKKVVDRTFSDLQSAFNPYGFAVVSARDEDREPPAPPAKLADYADTARETGLAHEMTGLLSGLELVETFVGKARDAQSRREFVGRKVFRDLALFEPYLAQDLDGNWYLVCKTEDVESRVPPLDEVHDVVVAAWKQREAAKLALQKAEEFAKQAEESGDTVAAVCSGKGYEVVTTDMFSWLTFGTTPAEMQRGPRLGEAPPLKAVGPEFMTKVFELKPDEKIALQNHDQSQTFVLQLSRREQTDEEMRQRFLNEANTWYGGRVMNAVRANNSQRQLIFQLTERVGLNLENLDEYWSGNSQQ